MTDRSLRILFLGNDNNCRFWLGPTRNLYHLARTRQEAEAYIKGGIEAFIILGSELKPMGLAGLIETCWQKDPYTVIIANQTVGIVEPLQGFIDLRYTYFEELLEWVVNLEVKLAGRRQQIEEYIRSYSLIVRSWSPPSCDRELSGQFAQIDRYASLIGQEKAKLLKIECVEAALLKIAGTEETNRDRSWFGRLYRHHEKLGGDPERLISICHRISALALFGDDFGAEYQDP